MGCKEAEWGCLGGRSGGSGEAESRYSHVGLIGSCVTPVGKINDQQQKQQDNSLLIKVIYVTNLVQLQGQKPAFGWSLATVIVFSVAVSFRLMLRCGAH